MVGILHIKSANNKLKALAYGLLLAMAISPLPACASEDLSAMDAGEPSISVMTAALPAGFNAKSLAAGLTVIEIERLDSLNSDIVYLRLANNQTPDDAFKVLNAAFPKAGFELLDTGGDDFDLIGF